MKKSNANHSSVRDDSDYEYLSSPEVIIHKKDFLIHIKKVSARSQSTDCATERKRTPDGSYSPRRSSSANAQRLSNKNGKVAETKNSNMNRTFSSEGNVYLKSEKNHIKSLRRHDGKRGTASQKQKAKNCYGGSHSTTSLQRSVAAFSSGESFEKAENSKNDSTEFGFPSFSAVDSIGENPDEVRKKALIHGFSNEISQNCLPLSKDRKRTDKRHHKLIQTSQSTPMSKTRIPQPSSPSTKSLPRRVKFAGSLSAPLPLEGQSQKCTTPKKVRKAPKNDAMLVYPKKVSSEYTSANVFKISEGINLSDYDNVEPSSENNKSGKKRGYNITWRQRLLGSATSLQNGSSTSLYGEISRKVTGRAELEATWLQLKADIENAMAMKPDNAGEYKDLRVILKSPRKDKVCTIQPINIFLPISIFSQICRNSTRYVLADIMRS